MSLIPQRLAPYHRKLSRSLREAFATGLIRAKREGWLSQVRGHQDCLAVAKGCWFDKDEATHVVGFMRDFLRHSKGEWAGQPFELLPWQRDEVIEPIFGWRRADGTRRYRRGYLSVPKKNGKSSLASAIELVMLVYDCEPGAEVYTAATARDQASITWTEAARMVKASPELRSILTVHDHVKTINYKNNNAFLKALSAEAKVQEGLNIHGLIVDELHAWTDRAFWDALYYGGAARRQPLQLSITTAGDDLNSVCHDEYTYAHRVISGAIDDWEYFALIYEADKDANPIDPAVWRAANPSLGSILKASDIEHEMQEAQDKPGAMARFKRYRLNIWVQQHNPWLTMERWDACREEGLCLETLN